MTRPPLWLSFCPGCGAVISTNKAYLVSACPKCRRQIRYSTGAQFGAAEWESENRPEYLFDLLPVLGLELTERRNRLIHAGVARVGFGWIPDDRYRAAITAAEVAADAGSEPPGAGALLRTLPLNYESRAESDTQNAYTVAVSALRNAGLGNTARLRAKTRALYADAYRELFPNPFFGLAWDRDWFTSTVQQLAARIYDAHDFEVMPILADALQDAGCNDERVLNHCRANKPHVRGCWVLDAVLGKS